MLLTKKELAKNLKISLRTVDRLMTSGIPYIKIGKSVRFDFEAVMEWFKSKSGNQ